LDIFRLNLSDSRDNLRSYGMGELLAEQLLYLQVFFHNPFVRANQPYNQYLTHHHKDSINGARTF
jgi:hypothetical protein